MNTCRTCLYWDTAVWNEARKIGLGWCHSEKFSIEPKLESATAVNDMCLYMMKESSWKHTEYGIITGHQCTGPDFGCLHHLSQHTFNDEELKLVTEGKEQEAKWAWHDRVILGRQK